MVQNCLDKIAREFDALEIRQGAKEKVMPYLEALRDYHKPTFEHSARVADLGKRIAEFTHITEPKALWLPGLVHDLGKLKILKELLDKATDWNEEDAELMKKHVEFGCLLLSGLANFSALATFYSHYFKKEDGYPSDEDFKIIFGTRYDSWSEASRTKGRYCGRLVALSDTYDAITTRKNDKFSPGEPRLLSPKEAETILLANNQDQEFLIRQLYKARIFGASC